MQRLQAFKYELIPTGEQLRDMRRFAGSCRFVFNKALALQTANYEAGNKFIRYVGMANLLPAWKSEFPWLKESPSQALQHSLKNLDRAFTNFFEKRTYYPHFKKRGYGDSVRFPQGFKLDQTNDRVILPKLGWVRYRNSREVLGVVKNVTLTGGVAATSATAAAGSVDFGVGGASTFNVHAGTSGQEQGTAIAASVDTSTANQFTVSIDGAAAQQDRLFVRGRYRSGRILVADRNRSIGLGNRSDIVIRARDIGAKIGQRSRVGAHVWDGGGKPIYRRAVEQGRRLLWLHTYGERFLPAGAKRGQVPAGTAKCIKGIPTKPEAYPEEYSWTEGATPAEGVLRVGAGEFAPRAHNVLLGPHVHAIPRLVLRIEVVEVVVMVRHGREEFRAGLFV